MSHTPSAPSGLSPRERAYRSRYALTTAALFLLVLTGFGLPLPQRLVVAVPLLVALVVSVRELFRLARARMAGLARLGAATAVGISLFLLLGMGTQLLFYAPQQRYEQCLSGANTETAKAACAQERQQGIIGTVLGYDG